MHARALRPSPLTSRMNHYRLTRQRSQARLLHARTARVSSPILTDRPILDTGIGAHEIPSPDHGGFGLGICHLAAALADLVGCRYHADTTDLLSGAAG